MLGCVASRRVGFSTISPLRGRPRPRRFSGRLGLGASGGRSRASDRRAVAGDVADQATAQPRLDQRRVRPLGQRAGGERGEGPAERRLARHLTRPLPAAKPAQNFVHEQAFTQHHGHRQPEDRLGQKGPGQRRPAGRRPTRPMARGWNETFDPGEFQSRNQQPMRRTQRSDMLLQPGEKLALDTPPMLG